MVIYNIRVSSQISVLINLKIGFSIVGVFNNIFINKLQRLTHSTFTAVIFPGQIYSSRKIKMISINVKK